MRGTLTSKIGFLFARLTLISSFFNTTMSVPSPKDNCFPGKFKPVIKKAMVELEGICQFFLVTFLATLYAPCCTCVNTLLPTVEMGAIYLC